MKCSILIFLILASQFSHAQDSVKDSIELILNESHNKPYDESIKNYEQALKLARNNNLATEEVQVLIGIFNKELSVANYTNAINYLEQAENVIEIFDLKKLKGVIKLCKGDFFIRIKKWKEGYQVLKKAEIFSIEINDSIGLGNAYNGLGLIASFENRKKEANQYYEKSLGILERNNGAQKQLFSIRNNLAVQYLFDNKPQKSLVLFEYLLKDVEYKSAEAKILGNIAYAHFLLKNYKKAFQYYKKSEVLAKAENFKETLYILYQDRAETYKTIGDYKNALVDFKKYHDLKEEVQSLKIEEQIAEIQIKYDTERKEKELLKSQKVIAEMKVKADLEQMQRWLLFGGILVFSSMIWLIYLSLKNFLKQKEAQERILESDLKSQILEKRLLKEQLNSKNKDITNLSLDIVRKNDFSEELKSRLDVLEKELPAKMKSKINELQIFTVSHLQINDDLVTFQTNVDQVHQQFYEKLDNITKKLSQKDKQLCGLVRLNLSNKEIAIIRKISADSAKVSKYRLKKKLGLKPEEDMVTFLHNI